MSFTLLRSSIQIKLFRPLSFLERKGVGLWGYYAVLVPAPFQFFNPLKDFRKISYENYAIQDTPTM